jgi:hypothetical protein
LIAVTDQVVETSTVKSESGMILLREIGGVNLLLMLLALFRQAVDRQEDQ